MADPRRAGLLLAGALLAVIAPLRAAPAHNAPLPNPDAGRSVFLEDLTSPELAQRVAAGTTTALVPVGGTEQSGAHLVLGKHNARVKVLAGRIAQALGNAVVTPVVAYVPEGSIHPPAAHMKYTGTISIPEPTFEALLAGTARSLREHGFRDVIFLGDHGGYQASLKHAADAVNHDAAAKGASFRATALDTYYRVTQTAYVDALKSRGYTLAEIGQHAGLADTSLSLALAPEGVRADALAAGAQPQSQPGVAGDPRRASAALGQLGVQLIIDQSVAAIRAATARP